MAIRKKLSASEAEGATGQLDGLALKEPAAARFFSTRALIEWSANLRIKLVAFQKQNRSRVRGSNAADWSAIDKVNFYGSHPGSGLRCQA
jgi:hypothetical protein